MPSTRRLSRTSRPSGSSRSTRRPKRRRAIVYLTDVDIAHAVHRLAEVWFPEEKYGSPMPRFQFDGRQGLDRFLSAVNLPRQPYYRTIHHKAAALFRSLVKNHSLRDGNKRLGVTAMQVFLILNHVDFKVPQDLMVQTALTIAEWPGNFPLEIVTKWIKSGCTGRPRSVVEEMILAWPAFREQLLYESKQADETAGIKSRIPGRRVRLSKAFMARLEDQYELRFEDPALQRQLEGIPG